MRDRDIWRKLAKSVPIPPRAEVLSPTEYLIKLTTYAYYTVLHKSPPVGLNSLKIERTSLPTVDLGIRFYPG